MKKRIFSIVISVITLAALWGYAGQTRHLQWVDLQKKIVFDDPFAALTKDQLHDLSLYAGVKVRKITAPESVTENMEREAKKAEEELRMADIDIEELLSKREEVMNQRKKAAYAVVPELDGQNISIPGYALPLDYSGKRITEFLLVPWVGACIHTPPPPPNQIVYVKVEEGFASKGQFTPVVISGQISVEQLTTNLYLKDGSGDIDVGYTLLASDVSLYKQ